MVTVTVLLAVTLGVLAALVDSRLFVGIVTIGVPATIWGGSHLIERLTGSDFWHFDAPHS
jgi:hypothetical protein